MTSIYFEKRLIEIAQEYGNMCEVDALIRSGMFKENAAYLAKALIKIKEFREKIPTSFQDQTKLSDFRNLEGLCREQLEAITNKLISHNTKKIR